MSNLGRTTASKLDDIAAFRLALCGSTIDLVRALDTSKGDGSSGFETFARITLPSVHVATLVYEALMKSVPAHILAAAFCAEKHYGPDL